MDNPLDVSCKIFIQNRDIIKTTFKWDSNYMFPICSSIFIGKGTIPNKETLVKCNQLLKENTSSFSNFNSILKPVIVSTLSTYTNPQMNLKNALKIYDMLKKEFRSSEYLVVSSMMLAELNLDNDEYVHVINKSREIYKLLKLNHPLLTSNEDIVFCTFAALSPNPPEHISKSAEECYVLLKPYFSSANAVQSLAHIISLYDGNPSEKVAKVITLYNTLKSKGYKYGKGYDLASIGILAMLPLTLDKIIEDLVYLDNFLSTQKGYGLFGFSKCNKLMHASMLLCSHYLEDSIKTNIPALTFTLSLFIAQQFVIIITCITASAAASAAST